MPFMFSGVFLLLEVLCIVHAVRNDRVFPWVYILVFLPGAGMLAYFFVEMLPSLIHGKAGRDVQKGIVALADPNRGLREAKSDVEIVGSAEAKRTLAEEYLRRNQPAEAVPLYQSALIGIHADDPALLYGLARAEFSQGNGAGAQEALDRLQAAHPKFSSADAHLLYARALELQGKTDEALADYESLIRYFPGEEARCRYALLLRGAGRLSDARAVLKEIVTRAERSPKHYRRAQREWLDMARRQMTEIPG